MRFKKYSFVILFLMFIVANGVSCKEKDIHINERIKGWEKHYKVSYSDFIPEYDIGKYPPKVLFLGGLTHFQMMHYAKDWKKIGVDGFIIDYVTRFKPGPEAMDKVKPDLSKSISVLKKKGIEDNFLLIYLGRLDTPEWTADEKEWTFFFQMFEKFVVIARESGCKGIALDTEPYKKKLWSLSPDKPEEKIISALIEEKSEKMGKIIKRNFPDAKVLIFPEGDYRCIHTKQRAVKNYRLWKYFYRGLIKARLPGKIILCPELTYHIHNPHNIKKYIYNLREHYKNITPKDYISHIDICPGSYPLGRYYKDKRAMMSFRKFESQIRSFEKYSGNYIWIYGHGAAWWQLDQGFLDKCIKEGKKLWSVESQLLPVDPGIDEYYQVLNRERKNVLKQYYLEIQKKSKKE